MQKQGLKSVAKVFQEKEWKSTQPIHAMFSHRRHAAGANLDRLLASFAYHHAVPFRAICSEQFQDVIETAIRFGAAGGTGYSCPSRKTLQGHLFDARYLDVEEQTAKLSNKCAEAGITLTSDGWSNCQR